jgi:hypothetical protein
MELQFFFPSHRTNFLFEFYLLYFSYIPIMFVSSPLIFCLFAKLALSMVYSLN